MVSGAAGAAGADPPRTRRHGGGSCTGRRVAAAVSSVLGGRGGITVCSSSLGRGCRRLLVLAHLVRGVRQERLEPRSAPHERLPRRLVLPLLLLLLPPERRRSSRSLGRDVAVVAVAAAVVVVAARFSGPFVAVRMLRRVRIEAAPLAARGCRRYCLRPFSAASAASSPLSGATAASAVAAIR
jgi:hypothetical protein